MRLRGFTAAMLAAACMAGSAGAQTAEDIGLRVGKLEKEMRAVQRSVFPNGTPVTPEIGGAPPATAAGTPSLTPVADLSARVDAMEKQLASITGQVEQDGFRLRQAEDAMKRLEARVATLEGGASAAAATPGTTEMAEPAPAPVRATPKPPPHTAATDKPAPAPVRSDPGRKAALAAIEMPSTGDAAEDAYTYGFRLYTAKFYPEAEAALKAFVAKYPAHKRASYAQNLLGRAYYDEGKPALASVAFYDNYQKMPKGERAPESLYWLGQALIKLKKLPDACKVYDELQDVYGAKLSPDLKTRTARGRADAKCTA